MKKNSLNPKLIKKRVKNSRYSNESGKNFKDVNIFSAGDISSSSNELQNDENIMKQLNKEFETEESWQSMVKSTIDYFDEYQNFHIQPARKKGRETF